MQDTDMVPFPAGGPHEPLPPEGVFGGGVRSAVLDLPIMAVDDDYVYVTSFGRTADIVDPGPPIVYGDPYTFSAIFIIPIDFDEGGVSKSMLDGDKPAADKITILRPRDLPESEDEYEKDFFKRQYPVQEPFEQVDNAQFFISIDEEGGGELDTIRICGLWLDSSVSPAEWRYTQRLDSTTLELDDVPVPSGAEYFYSPATYDVATPDSNFSPATTGAFMSSAVLAKDTSGDFKIFATHHVYTQDGMGTTNGVEVQWYVIDPDIDDLREVQDPPTWTPTVEACGRISTDGTNSGDCYHPAISVTEQGVAVIDFTYSSVTTWPQIRRAVLANTYTSVATNSTVREGPENYSYTPSNPSWADFNDMQADPFECKLWSIHALVHNPGGQPPTTITTTDMRDLWVVEVPGNCENANLNGDSQVDVYDMALFSDYYDAGARRVDMNTDGTTDATDAALYADAYDDQRP